MSEIKERQLAEAVKRLKMLRVHPNVIKDFTGKGYYNGERTINYSERAILYWVEKEEWKKVIADFEEKYNAVVYHAIFSHTEFGDLLALLYVSEDEEEWEMDREAIIEGYAYAYVENLDDPLCSEIGSIGIKPIMGGVVRTY